MKYQPERVSPQDMLKRSHDFLEKMKTRRSVRQFSSDDVPMDAVINCIAAAGTAPSGAHKQPWSFCLVTDPEIRKRIRVAAEAEEYKNYNGRMSQEWMKDLEPFDTNEIKPFIEDAPGLIVVFKHSYGTGQSGKSQNYYVNESV